MRKFITLLALLTSFGGVFSVTNAYYTNDSRNCEYRCSGDNYEEPFCPNYCGGYERYSRTYYNTYYPNYSYNNNYNYSNVPGYYCVTYDNGNTSYNNSYIYNNYYYNNGYYNNGYYINPPYYNGSNYYQYNQYYNTYPNTNSSNFCDCRGRENCTCTFYPNPNQYGSTGYIQRCVEWRRR